MRNYNKQDELEILESQCGYEIEYLGRIFPDKKPMVNQIEFCLIAGATRKEIFSILNKYINHHGAGRADKKMGRRPQMEKPDHNKTCSDRD